MKQPDVFEKMVEKEYEKWLKSSTYPSAGWLIIPLKLLRRHHAKVRGMIKAQYLQRYYGNTIHNGVIDDILAALDRLEGKKGTR